MRRARESFFFSVALFAVTFILFSVAPVIDSSDSRYSMVLSESILTDHTSHLNWFQFPGPIEELRASTPPIDSPNFPETYQVGRVNGNVVYRYPNGSSILSLPYVAFMKMVGISAVTKDRKYDKRGEVIIQKTLAALLMALLGIIVFRTGLLLLNPIPSAIIALGFALGTQVWSTGTRALWSHTWFIFLCGLAVYQISYSAVLRRGVRPAILATTLSWMYFVRPTGAIAIGCVSVYVFTCCRRSFSAYAAIGAAWFAGFIAYSLATYGEFFPGYYRSRFDLRDFWIALYANLFSPSRGLFVYVPVLAFVAYLVLCYWKTLPERRLAILSIATTALTLLTVAMYPCWWGGGSYGSRLMTDILPWSALLAILACAATANNRRLVFNRAELFVGTFLLLLSVAINARGAFSINAHHVWNLEMEIDQHPERALDWSYPQFVAGLIRPPSYVTWRYPTRAKSFAKMEPVGNSVLRRR